MKEDLTFLCERELEVRWSDMDALRHVNNATYFTYLEMCRTSWFEQLGEGTARNNEKSSVVLAHVEMDYLIPIVFPAQVKIRMYGKEPGRSSLHTYYEFYDADDESVCYAKSVSVLVWIDLEKGKSVSVPQRVRDIFIK